jgi:REP element-mobilizing transposase RayT
MARPLRLEYPGALYHVSSRGNGRANIFRSDKDRDVFLKILDAVIQKYHWLLHAYCLMDNHYHLVVETPEGNLSRGMRQLNGMYTQKFNWRHHECGHIFQGRYKAILVDKESYLLELCRYVALNPVRAGIREQPENWPWSSYSPTAGFSSSPSFLATDWVLGQFGRKKKQAQARYQAFVLEGITKESPWREVKGQIFLGDTRFVDTFRVLLHDKRQIKEIPRAQRLIERPSLEDLFSRARGKENRNRRIYRPT